MLTLTPPTQPSTERLSQSNRARKRKRHPNQEKKKLSLFADVIILNIENPKDFAHTQKTIRTNKQIQ